MTEEDPTAYYRERAQQELAQAEASRDPAVAAIHRKLASRYAALVGDTLAVCQRTNLGEMEAPVLSSTETGSK